MYAWEKEYKSGRGRWRGTTNFKLDLPEGSRILEVGCGNGKHLSSLFNKGFELYAIDVSPTAISLAKERAKLFKAKANITVGDLCTLNFQRNFFDVVFLFHIVGHLNLSEREAAIAEAYRVLKPGGLCYFKGFERTDLRSGKGEEVEPGTFRKGNNVWVHYFEEKEVREAFQREGFNMESLALDAYKHVFHGTPHRRCEIKAVFRK